MAEKKAFVFDTNFIVQTKELDKVISDLSDRFTVYITQVSIDERIAQQCRELKNRFDEVALLAERNSDIADIKLKTTYVSKKAAHQKLLQKKYESVFPGKIIPFSKNGEMLSSILERANYKKPPFLSDEKASDKGFKDALLWQSLLLFFKNGGESEVLFLTDDNGFIKNTDRLCSEFNEATGKTIIIKTNAYYKDLIKPEHIEDAPAQKPRPIPPKIDLNEMREKIQQVLTNLCWIEEEGYWGDVDMVETFTISQPVDSEYMESVFDRLETVIQDHIFETDLPASAVLDLDNRVVDAKRKIPMSSIDEAAKLKREIEDLLPDYLPQFYSAAAAFINQRYIIPAQSQSPFANFDEDGELPF